MILSQKSGKVYKVPVVEGLRKYRDSVRIFEGVRCMSNTYMGG